MTVEQSASVMSGGADGLLRISGRVGYPNAAEMLAQGRKALDDGRITGIDLHAVVDPDSATLAMLLVWASDARRDGRMLALHGMPDALKALARLSDSDELLRIVA